MSRFAAKKKFGSALRNSVNAKKFGIFEKSLCFFFIFIHPTGQIRLCMIKFVSTSENPRKLSGMQENESQL